MRAVRWSVLALGLVLVSVAAADEPLPKGVKHRLGTTRMRYPGGAVPLAFTPDGKFLVAPGRNGFAKIDVTTGEAGGVIGRIPDGVGATQFELSANGARAATTNADGVTAWETESGKVIARFPRRLTHGGPGIALSADGSTLAAGLAPEFPTADTKVTVVVWDLDRGEKRTEVEVLQNRAVFAAISGNGRVLATWGRHLAAGGVPAADNTPDRIIQFWDAATGKELSRIPQEGFGTLVAAVSPDGQLAAVSAGTGTIGLVDPRTSTVRRLIYARTGQARQLLFSPDGKTLAAVGPDSTVQMWNTDDGQRLSTTECPLGQLASTVRGLRFVGNRQVVVCSTIGVAAMVWEAPSGKLLSELGGHTAGVSSLAFMPDGKQLVSAGIDGNVLRWDPEAGKLIAEVEIRPTGLIGTWRLGFGSAVIATDGSAVIAERGGSRAVYDPITGAQTIGPWAGVDTRGFLCPDARTLLVWPIPPPNDADRPKTTRTTIRDLATGARLSECDFPAGDVVLAVVSPDRTNLVSVIAPRRASVPNGMALWVTTGWDLSTGKKLGEQVGPAGFANPILVPAPDNRTALATNSDGKLVILDYTTGTVLREVDTGDLSVTVNPVFRPDGRAFAVALGGSPPTVRLYNTETGKLIRTLPGHGGAITSLAYSPDGKTLAAGSRDTTIWLWDLTKASD